MDRLVALTAASALAALMLGSGCSASVEEARIGSEPVAATSDSIPEATIPDSVPEAAVPSSLPSADPALADDDLDTFYPDGVTRADLEADSDLRFELMGDWLDANLPVSSGHGVIGGDDRMSLQFSVDIVDRDEAAALCDTFRRLGNAYYFDAEIESVTIEGWVHNDDGSFGSSDWADVECVG